MTPQNPLNTDVLPLRDIHLPDPIGWWPPAPGWWLTVLLVGIGLLALFKWLQARHRRLAVYRSAMHELEQIEARYHSNSDALTLTRELSILLRRVAISISPREQSAGVTGKKWLGRLDELIGQPVFANETGQLLIEAPYRPTAQIDALALLALCQHWIKKVSQTKRATSHA